MSVAVPSLVVGPVVLRDLELVLDGVLPAGHRLGGPVGPPDAGDAVDAGDASDDGARQDAVRALVAVPEAVAAAALAADGVLLVDEEQTPLGRLTELTEPTEPTEPTERSGEPGERVLSGLLRRERRRESGAGRAVALDLARRAATGTSLVVLARPPLVADLDRVLDHAGPTASHVLVLVPDHRDDTAGVPTSVQLPLARAFAARLEARRPGLTTSVATAPLAWRDPASDARLLRRVAEHLGVPSGLPLSADRALDPAADDWASGVQALVTGAPTEVIDPADLPVLGRWRRPRSRSGLVVFFTGFSGSGKSTIARALHERLLEQGERTVSLLDGDVVRQMLSSGLGFDRAGRTLNIRRIGFVAAEVARHGGIAICAPVAPYDSGRKEARAMAQEVGDFLLVHVSTPLEECERRDLKGLYAKARAGLVPEFTGISDPYDVPDDADLTIDTTDTSTPDAVDRIVRLLVGGGWLKEYA